jgi:hypothetical protein
MFVKIREFKGNNLVGQITYDCKRASLREITPEPPLEDVAEMALILDVGEQDERTIITPCNRDNDSKETTEIYYMNDNGKTIDKYIY